ncbi:N-acetyltransferase [Gordonia amarae]|uniref:N-acetyltransferase domain-containing protein n=2 Tax=Gordonia amarae TaxID=36821 RepID=G7GQ43_9ACTN|nr:GNAT family N-acetyltransferase [Gordonia amarae]MCS3876779.1 putative GNAT family acetyltransferase [Gordonia amarae]QHN20194.1 N-acetyltransferase [Gordonia amarae]QHN29045.1 N-acetyltransferase [Gordonia amarae]QHN37826.1 N-acetyltransferase [Gordonia amarae]GAB05718.1 hypothetical protein GOAMR_43_00110 [Gordonia amarae NBRC 15530]
MSEVTVTDTPDEGAFTIDVDGTRAGLTAYRDVPGAAERIFYHTEIGDEFGGQGLASKLVKQALDESIAAGKTIVPVCPYVKGWVQKHPDYQSSTTNATPEHLALVR